MGGTGELISFQAAVTTRADRAAVLAVLRDLPAHLEWAGKRSPQKTFRLLSVDAPAGPAEVGTRFSSTGANMNGTFHDSSVVTVVEPAVFELQTDSRLDRKHGAELTVRFTHRYELAPDGGGTRIAYSCRAGEANYVPYWLKPAMRPMTRRMVNRAIGKQLRLLAILAEERSAASAPSTFPRG